MSGTAKLVLFLAVLAGAAYFLRINLPSNDVSESVEVAEGANILEAWLVRGATSQAVADWRITDFIVVKFACSDVLEMEMVAMPFSKWRRLDRPFEGCG